MTETIFGSALLSAVRALGIDLRELFDLAVERKQKTSFRGWLNWEEVEAGHMDLAAMWLLANTACEQLLAQPEIESFPKEFNLYWHNPGKSATVYATTLAVIRGLTKGGQQGRLGQAEVIQLIHQRSVARSWTAGQSLWLICQTFSDSTDAKGFLFAADLFGYPDPAHNRRYSDI